MKNIVFVLFLIISFSSCEDVIEIDIPSEDPRLIIDAIIKVDTSLQFQTE